MYVVSTQIQETKLVSITKVYLGPSINEATFKGEGVAKMGFWGNFQGLTEATGGGWLVKKREN